MDMDTSEVAAALGISRRQVQQLIRDGRLRARRYRGAGAPGYSYRVSPAALAAYLEIRRGPGRPRKPPPPSGA